MRADHENGLLQDSDTTKDKDTPRNIFLIRCVVGVLDIHGRVLGSEMWVVSLTGKSRAADLQVFRTKHSIV